MMNAIGQQTGKIRFHSINNVGMVIGKTDKNLQLQTINGIKYKTYSAGIGIGLDNYYFKTVPLFVDLRKDLLNKKMTPFAYVDLGASIPGDRAKVDTWTTSYYNSGFFYDMGLGYSFPVKGRFAVNISAGYSQKVLNEDRENSGWMWRDYIAGGGISAYKDTTYYSYTLRRISLKVGFSF